MSGWNTYEVANPTIKFGDTLLMRDISTDVIQGVELEHLLAATWGGRGANIAAMTADKTLTDADAVVQVLTPDDSSHKVILPAEAADNHPFIIINGTGGTFTFDIETDGASNVVEDIGTKIVMVVSDGVTWREFGPVFATGAEITTGTDKEKVMSPDAFQASSRNIRYFDYIPIAYDTAHTVTQVGGDWISKIAGTMLSVGAYVETAGTTGSGTYDIHKNGVTIMAATKISIETGEKDSLDAATQPVISDTAVAVGDIFTFFIDAIQTTPAQGLTLPFSIRET